eukprot:2018792-Pleurochrysis_carterae.AAC.1
MRPAASTACRMSQRKNCVAICYSVISHFPLLRLALSYRTARLVIQSLLLNEGRTARSAPGEGQPDVMFTTTVPPTVADKRV